MLIEDPIATCLSPPVYDMICKLGFEVRETWDIDRIVTQSGRVCWPTITARVAYTRSGLCALESSPSTGPCGSVQYILTLKLSFLSIVSLS